MARILSNNPQRGENNWRGFTPGRAMPVVTFPKRAVRRLMKRDPKDGLSQPFADQITTTHGVDSGVSRARTLSKARTAAPGAGKRVIPDRGQNKTLRRD